MVPSSQPSDEPSSSPSVDLPFINKSFIIKAGGNTGSTRSSIDLCLEPDELSDGKLIKTKICDGSDKQSWTKDQKGRFFNVADSSLCLKRKSSNNRLKVTDNCSSSFDQLNFGFDWFDSKFVMKKNPGKYVATISALEENKNIEFMGWTADNVLQKFTFVPDSDVIAVPPESFQIQSEIAGDYCLAPTSGADYSEVTPMPCSSADTAQRWFHVDGFFRSGISTGPCMKKGNDTLKIVSCDLITGISPNRFIYDFFDRTLSWKSNNKLVTIESDSVDSSSPAKVIARNLAQHPNGGQQWRIIEQPILPL